MPGTRRWTWSLAAPLLVLAGLLAMHGLAVHSGPHSGVETVSAMPGHTAMSAPAEPRASDDPGFAPVSGGELSGIAIELCVTVLLGGLAWLFLVTARRRTPWRLPRQVRLAVPAPRSRAPDPPSPAVLSVYRC